MVGFVVGRSRVRALWAAPHALGGRGRRVPGRRRARLHVARAHLRRLPRAAGHFHQLAIAAFEPENGPNFEKLPDSAYRRALDKYIGTEYPVAAQATLGVLAPLGVLEIAWLYHPFLAFLVAMGALSLYTHRRAASGRASCAPRWRSPARRPHSSTAFALQGSIKEIAGLAMLLAAVAATADLVVSRRSARALIAVVRPRGRDARLHRAGRGRVCRADPARGRRGSGLACGPWGARPGARRGAAGGGRGLALAAPVLSGVRRAYNVRHRGARAHAGSGQDLGNLAAPLDADNASGIWLNGDYRWRPDDLAASTQPILVGLRSCSRRSPGSCGRSDGGHGARFCFCWRSCRHRSCCSSAASRTPTRRC